MAAEPLLTRSPRAQRGFNLLEVLVALFIITVGLLGLAGMQVAAQQAELEAYQRAQAMVLMNDIVDRINTNRKAATCYAVTTVSASGYPYLGSTGTNKYSVGGFSCAALATNPPALARASTDLQLIDAMLLGASETKGTAKVGAIIGARACIGFDAASQSYTVAVAWQGLSKTFSPASWPAATNPAVARNCALYLYGATNADDTQRRVLWTTIRVASLT
jgi:type IV pilus assembly protein PilV